MIPHPNPETDAALTWAGGLAYRLHEIDRRALAEAYQGPDAVKHRKHLQTESPEILRQLVEAVKARLAELPK